MLSLLMPAFSLVNAPPVLPLKLHCEHDAPLPIMINHDPEASGVYFSPHTLSAQNHIRPVSCYALFKGVAASKPTSWLFM